MNAILAAAIILVVFAVGDMISAKTKAVVSMLLIASVIFLLGFWIGIFPTTMFTDSTLLSMSGLLVTMLLVHLGTTIKLRDFGAQWRTVIIAALACIAIAAAVFFIGQLVIDRGFALVGAPILAGGVVATLQMQDMANNANLPELAVFATLVMCAQGFVGYPVASLCLKSEAKRIKAQLDAGTLSMSNSGIARTLCHMRDQFAGTVKFIFEPSEDLLPGGARKLVAAGVMENPHVDGIFGMHVCPSENDTVGQMQLYKGFFTSAVDLFHIAVHGKSGHGSAPHTANDAIACAGYLITVLQTVVSRRIDPMDSAVLTVGTMSGGDAVNITAGEAQMVAVLRSFSDMARETAITEVKRICRGIGIAFNCDIEVVLEEGYALQYNDSAMIDLVDRSVTEELGADKVRHLDRPFTGSEDFSFFGKLTGTPSAFMMIDAGRGDEMVSLHNGKIIFNENVMRYGVAGMSRVALEFLKH